MRIRMFPNMRLVILVISQLFCSDSTTLDYNLFVIRLYIVKLMKTSIVALLLCVIYGFVRKCIINVPCYTIFLLCYLFFSKRTSHVDINFNT